MDLSAPLSIPAALSLGIGATAVLVVALSLVLAVLNAWANRCGMSHPADLLRLRRSWSIDLGDERRTVQVEHWYLHGLKRIRVDGKVVGQSRDLWDGGSRHRFWFGDHACTLSIEYPWVVYRYRLAVDGRWLDPVDSPHPPMAAVWVCPFVVLCGLIIFQAAGGVMPTLIGAGGMLGCLDIGRRRSGRILSGLALCFAIAALCWTLYFLASMFVPQLGRWSLLYLLY